MANGITTAFWGMVINNYDENDLVLVQNGYTDHFRESVHSLEKGESGTPHIQAWIKLQRQQRLSFMKKLFPRGNFRPLTSDEYIRNAKTYAQKLDATAEAAVLHRFIDPTHSIESVIKSVVIRMIDYENLTLKHGWKHARQYAENAMVVEDYKYAKIFVSDTYNKMWKLFGESMIQCILERHTHTHTHSGKIISREGGITTEYGEDSEESPGEDEEGNEESVGEDSSDSGAMGDSVEASGEESHDGTEDGSDASSQATD